MALLKSITKNTELITILILLNVYRLLRFKITLHKLSEGNVLAHKIEGMPIIEREESVFAKIQGFACNDRATVVYADSVFNGTELFAGATASQMINK